MHNSQTIAISIVEYLLQQTIHQIQIIEQANKKNIGTWFSAFLSGLLQYQNHINDKQNTNISECPQLYSIFKTNSLNKIIRTKSVDAKTTNAQKILPKQTMKLIPSSSNKIQASQQDQNQKNFARFIKLSLNTETSIRNQPHIKQQIHFNIKNKTGTNPNNHTLLLIRSKRSIKSIADNKQNKKDQKQFVEAQILNFHIGAQKKVKSKSYQTTVKAITIPNEKIKQQKQRSKTSGYQKNWRKKDKNMKIKQKIQTNYCCNSYIKMCNQMKNQVKINKKSSQIAPLKINNKNRIHIYNLKKARQMFPEIEKNKEIIFPSKTVY